MQIDLENLNFNQLREADIFLALAINVFRLLNRLASCSGVNFT